MGTHLESQVELTDTLASSMSGNEKYDNMFMHMAQEVHGIDNLFDTFFGFLFRKTDFFTGVSHGDSKVQVLKSYSKFVALAKEKEAEQKEAVRRAEDFEKERAAAAAPVVQDSQVQEVTEEEAEQIIKAEEEKKKPVESVEASQP